MSRRPLPHTNRQNQDAGSSLPGEPALLVVGRLRHAHGVKGEISMEVLTDFPERLMKGKQVFVGESHAPKIITGTRWKDKVMLLTFEGYTDCDQVNLLRNAQVYIRTENLPSLPEGEYYFHQLVGLKVRDEAGAVLGQLEEVMETGANDVYLVRSPTGEEILLPAIAAVIIKVDLEGGEMIVRPPVGPDLGKGMADQHSYWVGFNLVKGIGSVRLKALLSYFGDLSLAWDAPADALISAGLSQKIIENLQGVRSRVNLDNYLTEIQKKGIQVITWEDAVYPARLKEIDQPPPVLYIRGSLTAEDTWAVSVVGTRRPTAYGKQVAEELGTYLARNGITVISGLARGIDSIAHHAALKAGGRTVAVLGSGVDCVYPPEHQLLADKIIAQGCLMSDYPPGTPPDSINFPARNRIISGLALATVVVEAGETSGALITSTFAAEQGREVLAIPGNIFSPQSKGTNRLILEGARPLLVMQDVLEVLNLKQISQQQSARQVLPADATEAHLLQILGYEPLHVDEICAQAGLPIEKVSATLSMMELKGMARQVGGMSYVVMRENQASYDAD